ncbi:hypothetical protein [Rhizobium rhizoryzae]|uniref:Uncharacterized protein n=1 Tax=Rhizobium rhizoryzae TaxID=451876 RepID=A0A7W6LN04_9HYPH|nr:hypothetical protein [Rhizobium rhizoryzae]MBB4146197.1 hypothetical protein [Rhizobium rhizoryzae]
MKSRLEDVVRRKMRAIVKSILGVIVAVPSVFYASIGDQAHPTNTCEFMVKRDQRARTGEHVRGEVGHVDKIISYNADRKLPQNIACLRRINAEKRRLFRPLLCKTLGIHHLVSATEHETRISEVRFEDYPVTFSKNSETRAKLGSA